MAFEIARLRHRPAPGEGPSPVARVVYQRLYRPAGARLRQNDQDEMQLTLSFDPLLPLFPRVDFVYPFGGSFNAFDNEEIARLWSAFLEDPEETLMQRRLGKPLYRDELRWLQERFARWLGGRLVPERRERGRAEWVA